MTREAYRLMREKEEFDIQPFYTYYGESLPDGAKPIPISMFANLFDQWLKNPEVDKTRVVDKVITHFDQHFNVVALYNKDNKLIKVY